MTLHDRCATVKFKNTSKPRHFSE